IEHSEAKPPFSSRCAGFGITDSRCAGASRCAKPNGRLRLRKTLGQSKVRSVTYPRDPAGVQSFRLLIKFKTETTSTIMASLNDNEALNYALTIESYYKTLHGKF